MKKRRLDKEKHYEGNVDERFGLCEAHDGEKRNGDADISLKHYNI
jgi:hypothetical protein